MQKFGLNPTKGDIGIEIEMEGNLLPDFSDTTWGNTYDDSLRGESIEYVLKNPVGIDEVEDVLNILWDNFDDTVLKPSVRTGVHIHINVQELSMKELATFITLYFTFEGLLTNYCGPNRTGNHFCLRAEDAEYLMYLLCSGFRDSNYNLFSDDSVRYSALNVCALPKYGSLEFRAMRTTKEYEPILTWVNLLYSIKKASLKYDNPQEIIKSTSAVDLIKFIEGVFVELTDVLLKPTNNVRQTFYSGVRVAQDLAFCRESWDEEILPEPLYKKKRPHHLDEFFVIEDKNRA
jgi:hypothetical protein